MKHLLTAALLAAAALTGWAQQAEAEAVTPAKCLSAAPEGVFGLIGKPTRLDMIDYYEAGLDKPSTNFYGGDCRIVAMDERSATIEAAPNVSYQVFVLDPDSPEPTIGVIETIATPLPDSRLALYDKRWQPLGSKAWGAPTLGDWLLPSEAKHRKQAEEELPFVMASYAFDPATGRLVATNQMEAYYAPGDAPAALAMLKPSISYAWNGKQFKPAK